MPTFTLNTRYHNSVRLMDGKVNNSFRILTWIGVRVLTGDQSGYAYVRRVTCGGYAESCPYCRPHRFREQRQTNRWV